MNPKWPAVSGAANLCARRYAASRARQPVGRMPNVGGACDHSCARGDHRDVRDLRVPRGMAARLAAINMTVDERIELRNVFEAEKWAVAARPSTIVTSTCISSMAAANRQPRLLPASEALVFVSDLALPRDRPFLARAASHSRGDRAYGSPMRRNSHASSYRPAARGENRESPVPETTGSTLSLCWSDHAQAANVL